MQRSPTRDLVVGLFVLAGLCARLFLSVRVGGVSLQGNGGLTLYCSFDEIGGLKPHSKVTISGVKVGHIDSIALDEDYRARVEMKVDSGIRLPIDSSASVLTAGVLGDQYLSLQPGAEEDYLKDGETISFSESAVILERMIGKLIHNTDIEGSN